MQVDGLVIPIVELVFNAGADRLGVRPSQPAVTAFDVVEPEGVAAALLFEVDDAVVLVVVGIDANATGRVV